MQWAVMKREQAGGSDRPAKAARGSSAAAAAIEDGSASAAPPAAKAKVKKGKRQAAKEHESDALEAALLFGQLTLQNTVQLREVQSAVLISFRLSQEAEIYERMAEAGRLYAEGVKGNPGHGLGPPHAHVAAAMLERLVHGSLRTEVEDAKKAATEAQAFLGRLWTAGVKDWSREQVAMSLTVCRVRPLYQRGEEEATAMLQFSWNQMGFLPVLDDFPMGTPSQRFLEAISHVLVGMGGEYMAGSRPRGAVERKCVVLRQRLQGQMNG